MKNFKTKLTEFLSAAGKFFAKLGKKCLLFLRAVWVFIVKLWKHKKGRTGIIMTLFIILVALFAPLLTPYDPYVYDVIHGLQQPSASHWLGTDQNGVDILTQLLYGTRISLMVGIVTGLGVTFLGAVLGVVAGYFGKVASSVILNIINVILVIPTFPLMLVLNKVSSSYAMMIFIFVVFGWCGTARMVRSQVLSLKNSDYVRSAELSGGSKWYVMWKHILPSVANLLIMNCALSCAGFMVAEAGLSFLGFGNPNSLSWGKILYSANNNALTSELWAWVLAPGVAIFFTVTGFMQIGYALEDIFNPRMVQSTKAAKKFAKLSREEIDAVFNAMDDKKAEEYSDGCQ